MLAMTGPRPQPTVAAQPLADCRSCRAAWSPIEVADKVKIGLRAAPGCTDSAVRLAADAVFVCRVPLKCAFRRYARGCMDACAASCVPAKVRLYLGWQLS